MSVNFKVRMSEVEVMPPEGKTSFSGIPESQFIDDVAVYMKVRNVLIKYLILKHSSVFYPFTYCSS